MLLMIMTLMPDTNLSSTFTLVLCKILDKNIELIFGADLIGDVKHSNADISKTRELLGYDPNWSFERGIEADIE